MVEVNLIDVFVWLKRDGDLQVSSFLASSRVFVALLSSRMAIRQFCFTRNKKQNNWSALQAYHGFADVWVAVQVPGCR